MLRLSKHALLAILIAVALTPSARALEHITLTTGFELDCARHEAIDSTHIRLYFNADGNYEDLRASEILRIEILPDPPAPQAPAKPAEAATTQPTTTEIQQILATAGNAHNIDEDLLASIVKAESNGRATAVSRAGAQGLMQLMPSTAHTLGVTDSFKPDQNIAGGTAYLDTLLKRYKDNMALALAAYNAGPGAVDRYHGIPPFRETRAYVARVIREFNRRKQTSALAAAVSR